MSRSRRLGPHPSALSDQKYTIYWSAAHQNLGDADKDPQVTGDVALENTVLGVDLVHVWMGGVYSDVSSIDQLKLSKPHDEAIHPTIQVSSPSSSSINMLASPNVPSLWSREPVALTGSQSTNADLPSSPCATFSPTAPNDRPGPPSVGSVTEAAPPRQSLRVSQAGRPSEDAQTALETAGEHHGNGSGTGRSADFVANQKQNLNGHARHLDDSWFNTATTPARWRRSETGPPCTTNNAGIVRNVVVAEYDREECCSGICEAYASPRMSL
ncbi:hypothetical protein BD410DRAFT_844274 [Rickenella mellea]|uniref:Uncharacterized protein n=1 Tax=Rickenella mellea TaxID=50990 RepID=A0A4Y7PME7_9AGAM|nr:hypothetical protein BD410DRAFT_844274 [Rickenella mellea]